MNSRNSQNIMPRAVLPFLLFTLLLCITSQLKATWIKDSALEQSGEMHQYLPFSSSTNITLNLEIPAFSNMVIN